MIRRRGIIDLDLLLSNLERLRGSMERHDRSLCKNLVMFGKESSSPSHEIALMDNAVFDCLSAVFVVLMLQVSFLFPVIHRYYSKLQVQALGLALRLGLEHSFTSSPEVSHLDAHTTLPQCQQTSLGADCLDVGTR